MDQAGIGDGGLTLPTPTMDTLLPGFSGTCGPFHSWARADPGIRPAAVPGRLPCPPRALADARPRPPWLAAGGRSSGYRGHGPRVPPRARCGAPVHRGANAGRRHAGRGLPWVLPGSDHDDSGGARPTAKILNPTKLTDLGGRATLGLRDSLVGLSDCACVVAYMISRTLCRSP